MNSYTTTELQEKLGIWVVSKKIPAPQGESSGKIVEGNRNVRLASLAGSMRKVGLSRPSIEAALQSENILLCDPMLLPDEVAEIARSISRYAPEFQAIEGAPLIAPKLGEFLSTEFKARELLIEPFLSTQSLSMIFGPRGIGKTRFAATVAIAAASGGSAFGWKAKRQVRTLYLDGEMAGSDLQGLFRTLRQLAPTDWTGETLRVFTPDAQEGGIPDLATLEGQIRVEQVFGDAELIFIDNLSAWVRGAGEENSAESWAPVAEWLMQLRQQGRSVVLLHHAGKAGFQRGTSKREDILDVVLALRRPDKYSVEEGARFEVHFEKARSLHGDAVLPFETRFTVDAKGRPSWGFETTKASKTKAILELHRQGLKQADIARQLNVARSTVSRAIKPQDIPPLEK